MAGKKLLVADDSLTIQKVIRLALSNEGYEIQAVSDGNDAIQQISLFRPDAVLIDVSLPGKTAFEVKRAINEHADLEEVRFILMSSAFEKVDEPQAAEVRFHGRLTKPFDPAHLRQVLTETLAQVAAKRLEPTSLLQRPASMAAPTQAAAPTAPVAAPVFPSRPTAPAAQPARPAPAAPSAPSTSTAAPSTPAAQAKPPTLPAQAQPAARPAPAPPASPVSEPFSPNTEFSEISISDISMSDDDATRSDLAFSVTPPGHEHTSGPEVGDDWMTPIQSNEPIMAPPPPVEDINRLWEQEPTLQTEVYRAPPPPSSPATLEPAPHGSERDADIRHLTESTIRMSGLDDFEWSVNEPSLKPPSQMLDTGNTSFQIEAVHEQTSNIPQFRPEFVPEISNVSEASSVVEVESPSFTGIPAPAAPASSPSDFYRDTDDVTKKLTRPTPFTPPAAFPPSSTTGSFPPRSQASPQQQRPAQAMPEAAVVGISPDQIEELLRKELQRLLPEIAEKIIKQEIHKMLSTQDGP